jgi:MFS family permease
LGAAFFSIGILNLVNNLRPYLFDALLLIPEDERGRLAGRLDVVAEIPTLLLAGILGALADRIGRRLIYATGFATLALSFAVFPYTSNDWTLYAAAVLGSFGAACVGTMLATVIADYPTESRRGRLVGMCFFLNGMGIASMVGVPARVPGIFEGMGYSTAEAVKITYAMVAGLCAIPFLITALGLAPRRAQTLDATHGSPQASQPQQPQVPLLTRIGQGIAAAREPAVRLAFASAAVTRAALSIVSGFFFLWMVEAGKARGMTATEAFRASGGILITVQITATFWAVFVITFIDRFDRVLAMGLGAALACVSYVSFGLVDNPFQPAMYGIAVLLGVGEMSGILASQTLIGRVAPAETRGAVIGIFTFCGGLGILLAALLGGYLFDVWRPSAPYILMGSVSGLLCCYAFWVYWRYPRTAGVV